MGDMAGIWRDVRGALRERKAKYGIKCPGCVRDHPRRDPTILCPGWRCKVCGYVDKRERTD